MPKALCLFSTDLMPWVIARHWLNGLSDEGVDVYVACPAGPYVQRLREFGLPVRDVYVSRNLNPLSLFRAFLSVRRLLRSEDWDVLNCHGAAAGLIGRSAAWASRSPVMQIITNHGYYFDENMRPFLRWMAISMERFLGHTTEFTMFISAEDHRTALKEKIVRDSSRCAMILNGIDLTAFPQPPSAAEIATARQKLDLPLDAEVIGFIGRLIVEKGLKEFLPAARTLCEKRPNLYVVVAGDALPTDRGAWKDEFIARVNAAGLANRFRFPGFVSDVYGCLSAFDILVHPTFKESFGRVIAEAMATGLPVVATNVRGCRELVVPGVTGLLTPYRDVDGLIQAISTLLDNAELRRSYGDAGRARVVEYYDQKFVIRKFVQHIREAWRLHEERNSARLGEGGVSHE